MYSPTIRRFERFFCYAVKLNSIEFNRVGEYGSVVDSCEFELSCKVIVRWKFILLWAKRSSCSLRGS